MVFRATRPFHPARLHKLLSAFKKASKRFGGGGDDKTVQQTASAKAEAERKAFLAEAARKAKEAAAALVEAKRVAKEAAAALVEAEREAKEAADTLAEATRKFKEAPGQVDAVSAVETKVVVADDKATPEASAFRGVIRSKGEIWLANAFEKAYSWHSAGSNLELKVFQRPYIARFIENNLGVVTIGDAFEAIKDANKREQKLFEMVYSMFDRESQAMEAVQDHIKLGKWTYKYGDRSSEMVLIGVHLDRAAMRRALEGALLTQAEMDAGLESWEEFEASHHQLCRQFCTPPYYTTPSLRKLYHHIALRNAEQYQQQHHLTKKGKKMEALENVGIVARAKRFRNKQRYLACTASLCIFDVFS